MCGHFPRQTSAVPRRNAPELCISFRPSDDRGRRECRVLAATHGPPANKKAGGSHHRYSRLRHSLRNGFTAYTCSPWRPGLFAPIARSVRHAANLASASGGQDHTTSPSAPAPFVRTKDARASPKRPSHPRLTSRDDRDTSLFIEAGWQQANHTFPKSGSRIFFARGLDSRISIELLHEFGFFAHAQSKGDVYCTPRHDLPRWPDEVARHLRTARP
jgi:hypothetical protein